MDGRADVVREAGERELLGADASAGLVGGFEHRTFQPARASVIAPTSLRPRPHHHRFSRHVRQSRSAARSDGDAAVAGTCWTGWSAGRSGLVSGDALHYPGPSPSARSTAPALVAQRIEHRPPEPCAGVRVAPRAPTKCGADQRRQARRAVRRRREGTNGSPRRSEAPSQGRTGAPQGRRFVERFELALPRLRSGPADRTRAMRGRFSSDNYTCRVRTESAANL